MSWPKYLTRLVPAGLIAIAGMSGCKTGMKSPGVHCGHSQPASCATSDCGKSDPWGKRKSLCSTKPECATEACATPGCTGIVGKNVGHSCGTAGTKSFGSCLTKATKTNCATTVSCGTAGCAPRPVVHGHTAPQQHLPSHGQEQITQPTPVHPQPDEAWYDDVKAAQPAEAQPQPEVKSVLETPKAGVPEVQVPKAEKPAAQPKPDVQKLPPVPSAARLRQGAVNIVRQQAPLPVIIPNGGRIAGEGQAPAVIRSASLPREIERKASAQRLTPELLGIVESVEEAPVPLPTPDVNAAIVTGKSAEKPVNLSRPWADALGLEAGDARRDRPVVQQSVPEFPEGGIIVPSSPGTPQAPPARMVDGQSEFDAFRRQ